MFVNPITSLFFTKNNNNYKNRVVQSEKQGFVQQLSCDVVSFKQKKVDLLKQPKEKIFKLVKESMTERNKLGEGIDAAVYKIKGTNYCIRRPFFAKDIESDFSLNIDVKDKINHVVANLGSGCRIMNIIKGFPVGRIDEEPEKLEYTEELIEKFPIESFNKLIKQITFAHKNDMVFDNHWANVIINPDEQTFTAIDFYDRDITDFLDISAVDPLSSIFSSVVNMSATLPQMELCAKKILKAGLEELKPNYQPNIAPEEFDFNPMLEWLKKYKKINLSEEKLEILKQSFNRVIELKDQELAGKHVKRALVREIESTKVLIDDTFSK